MCGIAGILRVYPPGTTPPPHFESIPEAWLDLLDDSIRHRGPDGQGRFRDRVTRADGCIVDVALIHRRLSILDHAGGAQPMVSVSPSQREGAGGWALGSPPSPSLPGEVADSSKPVRGFSSVPSAHATLPALFQGPPTANPHYVPLPNDPALLAVTFNGCIYNHRELRKELEAKGHRFVTDHSDTEVLLHGWREWGRGLPKRLEGMFSYIIWDRSAPGPIACSDLCGEKPLFQLEDDEQKITAFGSCYAGLVRLLGAAKRPSQWTCDPVFMASVVALGHGAPVLRVGKSHIASVEPHADIATQIEDDSSSVSCGRWFDAPKRSRRSTLDVNSLDALLRSAVHSRLDADVPMGIFLSGGIDSALVAAYTREARSDVPAFTVRMPDNRLDESQAAAATASHLGVRHNVLDCDPSPAHDLVRLVEQLGLPFGDSSLLPTTWVSRAVRQVCTVALGGDGSDELFCGYERYVADRLLQRFGGVLKHLPTRLWHPRSLEGLMSKMFRLSYAARNHGYLDLVSVFPSHLMFQLTGRPTLPLEFMISQAADAPRLDFDTYLPDDILVKSDSASMSVALELRSPFLARSVVDAALSTPLSKLMPRGRRKGLLRAVARKYLPAEIVDRPKMGFAIPVGEWFRSDFGQMRTLLLDTLNSADPFPADLLGLELNRRFIQQMLDEHMTRRRDHSQRLYMLLVLGIWCRWLGKVRTGTPNT
jgi:asparagine synthase (glutamine-hydrolysing)